jgi:hypothetical protein
MSRAADVHQYDDVTPEKENTLRKLLLILL